MPGTGDVLLECRSVVLAVASGGCVGYFIFGSSKSLDGVIRGYGDFCYLLGQLAVA
ncbi:hypothetical protein ACFOGG_16315 [Brenneria rubrifaciens]|uniref:hypothetical protein n=1 Tax=Brenneria rubrifaciens TaxID=55213 RepID=UPI00360DFD5D